jgi:uncharacterized membrane protein
MKNYFIKQTQIIQKERFRINIFGAILSYLCIIIAINYFILYPGKGIFDAFVLGILIYGVYETTNLALFNKWRIKTVMIDTLWGGILFALTTWIVRKIIQ